MWSEQQRLALDKVGRWLKTKDRPVFQLAGYAGTGKTTLAKYLVENEPGRVYFAAYTGKAAHVLHRSGVGNVSTIHKLIYVPKGRSEQRLRDLRAELKQLMTLDPVPKTLTVKLEKAIEAEKENLARPFFQLNPESPLLDASLLVVDEYSMINKDLGTDLMSFGCPVLALGDPGQLPPVRGACYFEDKPDVLLTEIHRQAADNPIIRLSKDIREGKPLRSGEYGDSRVVSYTNLPRDRLQAMVLSTDQLLVGKNATRISSNKRTRELLGHTDALPLPGDKLVCLRNNHEVGLLNGQLWKVLGREEEVNDKMDLQLEEDTDGDGPGLRLTVTAHTQYFRGEKPPYWIAKEAQEFDYGYALTVHKAQGSQWDNVLLFDEWRREDRKQWLYTAVTRAAERIDIVMM